MMRCLRCALDYPPEERYCHRCGRALSRPPGSKESGDSGQYSALQDTQYLYTTFSPPGSGGTVQAAPEAEYGAPVALPPSPRPGLPPSAALAHPTVGKRAEAALPPPSASSYGTAHATDDADVYGGRHTTPALPGGVFIAPPSGESTEPVDEKQVKVSKPVDDFDDEEDVLAAFRVKPAAIGIDAGSWRKASTRQRPMPTFALPRRLLAGVAVVVLLLAGGGVALWRHGIYASDINDARRYANAAQFPAAIDRYQAAINAWPLNADAKNGLASVQATMVTANVAATAVAVQAQAQTTAVAVRQGIYSARAVLRQQIAAQVDADANATATAVTQVNLDALATATAAARARGTAVAQAKLAAVATATAAAQAQATGTALARTVGTGSGDVSSVVRLVLPSVVRINVTLSTGDQAVGTGVVLSSNGSGSYIVTNAHVLQDATQIMINPQAGAPMPVVAHVENADADLAVLRVGTILPPANWSAGTLTIGQTVVAIGYAEAMNGSPTVTSGILSAAARDDGTGTTFIQHTAPINPGNSGGPLLDLRGHVLGINTFSLKDTQGLFFAIPASRAQTIANQLIHQITS